MIANPQELKEVEELKLLSQKFPRSSILILDNLQDAQIVQALLHSDLNIQFIAEFAATNDFFNKLHLVQKERNLQKNKLEIKKSVSQKYKDLTAFNANLEKMVDENTFHLKQSHNEEKLKLKQERNLVQFILEMQKTLDFEEAFLQIRRQLKTFKKVFEIVVFQSDSTGSQMSYVQQRQVKTENWMQPLAELNEPLWLSTQDQLQLASWISRPINRVMRVPLTSSPHRSELWLELIGTDAESADLLKTAEEIFKISRMVFDRIYSDDSVALVSQRWLQIFDGLKEPVAIISDEYDLIRANAKFYKKEKSVKCYESFAGRTSPCEGCPLSQQYEQTSGPQQIQSQGKFYAVHSHAVGPRRFVHYYEDVTQSRTLYARLIQTEKLGALGALAGQVAHELNNPLSGIKSLSQILKAELDPEGQVYTDLNEVEKAATRCQNIIHQLLEFTKDEGVEAVDCSLDDIIEKTLPLLKVAMRSHRVNIQLQAREKKLKLEPQLIQQVIFNLVQNACQAMVNPGQISISTREEVGFIVFEIQDTGPGVPEEVQARLFEAFFTTKKVGSGTGLGLYLSKKIIERFHGQLTFHSNAYGTVFTGRLPFKESNK